MVVWKRACMDVFMTVIDVSFDWIVNNIHINNHAFLSTCELWADAESVLAQIRV